jgi:hypothetical protein
MAITVTYRSDGFLYFRLTGFKARKALGECRRGNLSGVVKFWATALTIAIKRYLQPAPCLMVQILGSCRGRFVAEVTTDGVSQILQEIVIGVKERERFGNLGIQIPLPLLRMGSVLIEGRFLRLLILVRPGKLLQSAPEFKDGGYGAPEEVMNPISLVEAIEPLHLIFIGGQGKRFDSQIFIQNGHLGEAIEQRRTALCETIWSCFTRTRAAMFAIRAYSATSYNQVANADIR